MTHDFTTRGAPGTGVAPTGGPAGGHDPLADRLPDPERGVRREPGAGVRVERLDRPQQAEVPLGHQVLQRQPPSGELAGDADHQPQVGADQVVASLGVAGGHPPGQRPLLSRGEQRGVVDLGQVVSERGAAPIGSAGDGHADAGQGWVGTDHPPAWPPSAGPESPQRPGPRRSPGRRRPATRPGRGRSGGSRRSARTRAWALTPGVGLELAAGHRAGCREVGRRAGRPTSPPGSSTRHLVRRQAGRSRRVRSRTHSQAATVAATTTA